MSERQVSKKATARSKKRYTSPELLRISNFSTEVAGKAICRQLKYVDINGVQQPTIATQIVTVNGTMCPTGTVTQTMNAGATLTAYTYDRDFMGRTAS